MHADELLVFVLQQLIVRLGHRGERQRRDGGPCLRALRAMGENTVVATGLGLASAASV